jgi:hypothetical protein
MEKNIKLSNTTNRVKLYFTLFLTCLILLLTAVSSTAEIRVGGQGNVWARGNGNVSIQGGSAVEVTGSGLLKVNAGTVVDLLDGKGEKLATDNGEILYINFDGRAKITGEDIALEFSGANIVLNVRGTGSVTLKGVGIYLVGIYFGSWHPFEKTIITFTAPPEQ